MNGVWFIGIVGFNEFVYVNLYFNEPFVVNIISLHKIWFV